MENFPPNSLAAPPQSFRSHDLHDPLLGISSTSPTRFYQPSSQYRRKHQNVVARSQPGTNITGFTRDYDFSAYPSRSQQAALAVLKGLNNQVTLAWLTGLRSLRSNDNHWFQPGSLSSEQFDATSVLKDCPDDLVCAWLDFIRAGGVFDGLPRLSGCGHLDTQGPSAALLHNSWQGSSDTSRSSAGSFGALPSSYDGNTVPTTPTSSRSRETFLDLSTELSIDEATQSSATGHSHWCFICRSPRVITTCDGWKRHMKEHETRYRCMPRGPIEYTEDGATCAFCGLRDPCQSHCDSHKVFPCANKSLDVRSYTRKPHFITHLNSHRVPNGAELADHWKITSDKKHFSCGFCISHFNSLIEQLNHIDVVHYRLFHDVQDWDSNKVIRGLLLQNGVSESWRRILASQSGLMESRLCWDVSVIKDLQVRLQMGNEPADALAELAFNKSKCKSSQHGESETADATGLLHDGDIAAPQQAPASWATAPTQFNLDEGSVVDREMMTSTTSHTGEPGPWAVPNNSIHLYNSFSLRGGSSVWEEDAAMEMQHPDLDTSQRLMTGGGNYRTQPGPNFTTPWVSYRSLYPSLTSPNGLMMGNYWQATPILSPTNSSSIISNQPTYQSRQSVSQAHVRFANQLFPTIPSQKTTPPMQNLGLLAKPSLGNQPRKQPSRSKLKDHYDINTEADIDLDMDILQRLMREEDRTRSERRSR